MGVVQIDSVRIRWTFGEAAFGFFSFGAVLTIACWAGMHWKGVSPPPPPPSFRAPSHLPPSASLSGIRNLQ